MAVLEDGTLVVWGRANENTEDWNEQLKTMGSGFIAVSRYENNYLALKADGALWAWGLGKGAIFQNTPVQILNNVKQISGTGTNRPLRGPVKVMDNVVNVWSQNYISSTPAMFTLGLV